MLLIYRVLKINMDQFKTFAGPLPPVPRPGDTVQFHVPSADPWRHGEQAEAAKYAFHDGPPPIHPSQIPTPLGHDPWLRTANTHYFPGGLTGAEQNAHAILEAHRTPQGPNPRALGRQAMHYGPSFSQAVDQLASVARRDPRARIALEHMRLSHRPMHRR
jgi:hypothetical protein